MPSDAELGELPVFSDPLSPVPGESTREETEALAAALAAYQSSGGGEDTEPIESFVRAYPTSRWNPSLFLNLGLIAYETGYFGRALEHWRSSWELAKSGEDIVSQQIANRSLAEYARMNARVGRKEELDRIIEEAKGRLFMGHAKVMFENALEGRWMMEHRPGVAFRCGPYALVNLAPLLGEVDQQRIGAFLERTESPPEGFSLSEVLAQSKELGLELQMAFREPGAPVILPSVVHWKVEHYGALIREADDRYHLVDPTFGNDVWLSRRALDEEASGYFLVPEGPLPAGWRSVTEMEAASIFGRGQLGQGNPDDTGPDDPATPDQCPGLAMATHRIHLMLTSLSISDTPVGYPTPFGPAVRLTVTNNQREASQPTTMPFTNFSPQWVSNWISYIEDNPSSPSASVKLRTRGGGGEEHTNFNTVTQTYAMQPKDGSVLHKLTANTYKKVYPDGSEDYYEQYIGTTGTLRRVFLSRVRDAQGQQVAIQYNATFPSRISQIVDASGLATLFFYEYPGQPYLVTAVQDPFGRIASFTYAPVGAVIRLQSIEDVDGIVSSFSYDATGGFSSLTTPYGTTTFKLSQFLMTHSALIRFVEATDPYGATERVEFNTDTAETGLPSTLNEPTPDSQLVSFTTSSNNDRNVFYWDKQQTKLAPGDHSKAHLYHWLYRSSGPGSISILESEKPPLEGRIWYNYPGQTSPSSMGTLSKPSVVARMVENWRRGASTQAYRYEYNALGNITKIRDPLNRETQIDYATNGIDVTLVKQKVGSGWNTLTSYTYNPAYPAHRPATMTDGGGSTTSYEYNGFGQTKMITNARAEITNLGYGMDPLQSSYGRLVSITGAVPGGDRSFTYDDYGRIRTTSNSDGYTLTYDYDALDRVTLVTYPDTSFEQFVYEDHSMVASRDRAGRWTRHAYNKLRERVLTRDPEGRVTQFQWCRCGELGRLVDGNGNATQWKRDEQGRVIQKIFADGSDYEYLYDYSGRLVREIDAANRTKTFEYEIDDRVVTVDYSDASTADVAYTFDPEFPRVTTRTDYGTGTTSYEYHPFGGVRPGAGQIARINGPFPDDTVTYDYDELGRMTTKQIVDDATHSIVTYSESYGFDARGRVSGVGNYGSDSGWPFTFSSVDYTYVGQSNRVDTINTWNVMQVQYDYFGSTGDFLLKQIKNLGLEAGVISQFDYTYNQDRTINTWTIAQGGLPTTWTFAYDDAQQLVEAIRTDGTQTLERYAYDAAGNRKQVLTTSSGVVRSYAVNNLNQLTSEVSSHTGFGPTTFAGTINEPATVTVNGQPAKVRSTNGAAPYRFEAEVDLVEGYNYVTVQAVDGNNNRSAREYVFVPEGSATPYVYDGIGNLRFAGEREYRWDQENRLVRIVDGTHESIFQYDGQSRLVRIRELESGFERENHTFVWCGGKICQERSSNGQTVLKNFFSNGFSIGTAAYFYTRDHLGSVRDVFGADGVPIESRYDYSPWGVPTKIGGTGAESSELFTGHRFHKPSGLHLAHYRAYDASTGRWLSRDPLQEVDSLNLYTYTRNDPVNWLDPLGLLTKDEARLEAGTEVHEASSKDNNNEWYSWIVPDPNAPGEWTYTPPQRVPGSGSGGPIPFPKNLPPGTPRRGPEAPEVMHNHPNNSPLSNDDKDSGDDRCIVISLVLRNRHAVAWIPDCKPPMFPNPGPRDLGRCPKPRPNPAPAPAPPILPPLPKRGSGHGF